MATLEWVGGGNNQASNPKDWLDKSTNLPAVPQPGDSLVVQGNLSTSPFTMNVSGNDLAGNDVTLQAVGGPFFNRLTVNLSHRATMSATIGTYAGGTFNLSQNSTLNVSDDRQSSLTINISGNDTANIHGHAEINLDQGARWNGTFESGAFSGLVVNGGPNSVFNNNGSSILEWDALIGVDVAGKGSITIPETIGEGLRFMKSVGPHQSIIDTGGLVHIDEPNEFAASITLGSNLSGSGPPEIDLMRLAMADSYTYHKDMLRIFSGNKIIDMLRLANQTPYGFGVEKTASSVNVVTFTSSGETLPGALPIHVGS